jgi:hypothetical protein
VPALVALLLFLLCLVAVCGAVTGSPSGIVALMSSKVTTPADRCRSYSEEEAVSWSVYPPPAGARAATISRSREIEWVCPSSVIGMGVARLPSTVPLRGLTIWA